LTDWFFSVTFAGEYVHVWGIPAWGPWSDTGVQFRDEPALDLSLRLAPPDRERKIKTRSQLDAAVQEFLDAPTPRTLTLWVPERLMDHVRSLWETSLTYRFRIEHPSLVTPYR
jgi:hypothetical protein